MIRRVPIVLGIASTIIAVLAVAAATAAPSVTFNKDVLPILQNQCQTCHRPGEVAPMSLLTYADARPWAKSIKEAVIARKMPPWFADTSVGHFTNERKLSETEIQTLTAWVDAGAPEGDVKDALPPLRFSEGWTIGKPDIVIPFPHEIQLPSTGIVDQSNLLVKVNFPKDLWVKAAEVRPGNRRTVHHMKAWVRPPGSGWLKDVPEGEMVNPRGAAAAGGSGALAQDMLAKYNPGVEGQSFTVGGAAKFIPAGSDIVFEVHYNSTGKPETDRSSVGIVLADAPPKSRYITTTGVSNNRFVIPARNPHYPVKAETTVQRDIDLVWIQPHMHYRASEYEMRVIYPSGESKVLLKVPSYSFAWQIGYELAEPVRLPKGARLETTTYYDNSANNRFNPNPDLNVPYGPQSWDEMAVTFLGYIMDAKGDPGRVFGGRPAAPVE